MARHTVCSLTPAALAAAICCAAQAQTPPAAPADAEATLGAIAVRDSALRRADVSGWGDAPLAQTPIAATVVSREQMDAIGARRLSDLTTLDASVTDAYNAPGYWDFLTIRGFTLDNRLNYRREGLPISAETSIPLENKERVEILKGTSGIQAGTSAPGGLVNYVVKRPTAQDLRRVGIELRERGSLLGFVDLGGRAGERQQWGYRLNVAAENMRPMVDDLRGQRNLFALAADLRITPDSLLEAEIESSHKRQPSQQAFSLLGDRLPAPVNPRLNLNNQPWSQPSVFDALTGTLRFQQVINADWLCSAQAGRQRLKTDDRLAYAFGCDAEGRYDRYCSNGTFDLYDFRSENERRTQDAAQLALKGKLRTGTVAHDLGLSLLWSRVENRFQPEAYNYVGSGNVLGTAMLPADPSLTTQNTNRDERSVELALHDAIRVNERLTAWLGLRHTRLARDSVRTNGSRPTHYDQSFTTPFAAVSVKLSEAAMAYASAGQGIESQVVPNKASQYSNPGEALPALKSRQWEMGAKGRFGALAWQLAWFHVVRPMSNIDGCARLDISPCLGTYDGSARHQGLELQGQWTGGPWTLGAGLTAIGAKRQGSLLESATNGQRPTNVPNLVLRAQAAYRVAAAPGLQLRAGLSHEGRRNVLPDGSLQLPAWTRLDLGASYALRAAGHRMLLTAGIDNLTNRRYWKESPYQYGHVYLYPGAPRTLRLGLTVDL